MTVQVEGVGANATGSVQLGPRDRQNHFIDESEGSPTV